MQSLYFPVSTIKVKDLYDWSSETTKEKGEANVIDRNFQLSNVTKEKIALFNHEANATAADEKCSFQDRCDWLHRTADKSQEVKTATLKDRAGNVVEINGEKVALFKHKEKVFAINEKCPHQDVDLKHSALLQKQRDQINIILF